MIDEKDTNPWKKQENYDSNSGNSKKHSQILDEIEGEHFVSKAVRLRYQAELDGNELRVDDEPLSEREMGYGHHNEFEYGEYFYCTCGGRFWNKEGARDHLVEVKEQSD
jgi:hypothetical protein